MCGICGEIRFDGKPADVRNISAMMRVLEPRGPDSSGIYGHNNYALGHRRLKIIDLSEHAAQPMVDADLGLSIAFNGAIYNYPELREELVAKGYRFFSHGDTEVLLKAYHAWGERFVERLNGMFAFAIVERDSGRLILGRDRLGIKPLYLHHKGGALRFASTLPALLATKQVGHALSPRALHYYLTFHAVVPAPYTILEEVEKLPPATVRVVEADGTSRDIVYFSYHFDATPEHDFETYKEQTLEVLRRSVKRRLTADVPVGVLLSGGLDSSLVVGLLAEAGHQHIETFSIGFESVRDERGDEFQYSDLIAKKFGTRHHKLFVDSSQALPSLEDCIRSMSEPMVSHDNIGFYLLSQKVKEHVKVVQSGQGADEIFAGYHWYPPLMESQHALRDYAQHFFDRSHEEMAQVLEPDLIVHDYSREFVAAHFETPGATAAIDKALRLDTTVMLVDDPVKRVDNMTMAAGLEARVPFLDHEVVEFAARVPAKYKVPNDGKYVLKEAARQVIPAQVIDRPKGYFPVPSLKYLRGEYLSRVRGLLESSAARQRGVFRPSYVSSLLSQPEAHITPLGGSKLWQIALLEWWLQTHLGEL